MSSSLSQVFFKKIVKVSLVFYNEIELLIQISLPTVNPERS